MADWGGDETAVSTSWSWRGRHKTAVFNTSDHKQDWLRSITRRSAVSKNATSSSFPPPRELSVNVVRVQNERDKKTLLAGTMQPQNHVPFHSFPGPAAELTRGSPCCGLFHVDMVAHIPLVVCSSILDVSTVVHHLLDTPGVCPVREHYAVEPLEV